MHIKLKIESNKIIMKKIYLIPTLILIIAQFGCSPSNSDVIQKYQSNYQKKREQFKTIAKSLPESGGETECSDVKPPIIFNEQNQKYNTEMIMFDQLSDPDAEPEADLRLNGDLLNSIQWTGPKNPLAESAMDNNGSDMEKTLKSALDSRYLVVNRITDMTKPVATGDKTFSPGKLDMESFIVDLTTNKPVCSFAVSAETSTDVEYLYKEDQSEKDQLEKFAYSTMWKDAREKLVAELSKINGSDIEIK